MPRFPILLGLAALAGSCAARTVDDDSRSIAGESGLERIEIIVKGME